MAYKLSSPSMTPDKRKYVVASAEWGATLSAEITAFEARIKANRERNTELRVEARARKAEAKRMRTTAKRQAKTIVENKKAIKKFQERIKVMKQMKKNRSFKPL